MLELEKYFLLTKTQLEKGIVLCINKVHQLLCDAEILCENNGNESTAVALYTIAVEEFGKSLHLKKCIQTSNEEKIQVSKTIFGIGRGNAHEPKFDKAFSELPEECQIYQKIDFDQDGDKLSNKYNKYGDKYKKIISNLKRERPEMDIKLIVPLLFDFEIRKNALYVDWNDERKEWGKSLEIEQYQYKDHRKKGYKLDLKTGAYIKYGTNSVTVTDHPYDDEEIELPEEEIFPEKILVAIEFFKEHLKEMK